MGGENGDRILFWRAPMCWTWVVFAFLHERIAHDVIWCSNPHPALTCSSCCYLCKSTILPPHVLVRHTIYVRTPPCTERIARMNARWRCNSLILIGYKCKSSLTYLFVTCLSFHLFTDLVTQILSGWCRVHLTLHTCHRTTGYPRRLLCFAACF